MRRVEETIITFANQLSSSGSSMVLPLPNSTGLPPINSHLYVKWSEEGSDKPPGWYLCEIIAYQLDGKATIRYKNNSMEVVDVQEVEWSFT